MAGIWIYIQIHWYAVTGTLYSYLTKGDMKMFVWIVWILFDVVVHAGMIAFDIDWSWFRMGVIWAVLLLILVVLLRIEYIKRGI